LSKIIAVWGSPNSGKTTFAVKLAMNIYEQYSSTVIILHADMEAPVLPILFPNYKSDDLYSVGASLSKTDITQEEIIKSMVTVKGKVNFAFLGFKDSENKYTYPKFDEERVRSLFTVLGGLADYVVVDCTSSLDNVIARMAVMVADEVIRLASPDLKCISYYASQMPLYDDPKFHTHEQIQGLNVPVADLYMPIEDAKHHFRDICFTLPYCREIRQQMLDGTLLHKVGDKKFNQKFKSIAERLV
jgi:MinD-like ATPase involved in chromosome partitioning or flagellar assembly